MTENLTIVQIAAQIAFGIIIFAMIIALVRLIKGPSIPDRIVALDLIASLSAGFSILLVFYSNNIIFLDIAVFITMIVFIGTVAVSKYLKRRINDN
jgi:multicomponent Na+:H+ antiporter subunit F